MSAASSFTMSSVCLRQLDFADAISEARAMGFTSVDLVGLRGLCEHVPVNGDDADFRDAAAAVNAGGLRGASVNGDPGSFDADDDLVDVHARIDRLLTFCELTSTPLLVLPAGEKSDDRTAAPQMSALADGLNAAAARATKRGIRLAVEAPYFGRPIDTLDRTEELLALLAPDVEVALDVSHVDAADESVIEAWRRLGARTGVIHLRDSVSGNVRRAIGEGRIDFAAFLAAVDESGYGGDVVLELETRDTPYASKQEEVRAAVELLAPMRRNA